MRILVVTNLYPPHAFGGYEDLCAGAVARWQLEGHDVRVLTSSWRREDVGDASDPAGQVVLRQLPLYWDDHRQVVPGRWSAAASEWRSRRVVARALRAWPPDVVSVWNAGALSFSLFDLVRAHGAPVVLVLGDRWLEFGHQADAWRARFAGRTTAPDRILSAVLGLPRSTTRLGDPVVACFATEYLRDNARQQTTWELDEEVVVPHGLDTERFPVVGDSEPGRWGQRFLFVGRLTPEKGAEVAVRATAEVPGAHLTILGTGVDSYIQRLRRMIADLALEDRVELAGEADAHVLRPAYAAADALLFLSRWQEPFGIVPLEAMASGTPVIGTGTGGSGEFLVDGLTCMRVPPGDVDATAAAMRRLGADPALQRRLRTAGLRVAAWLDRSRTYADLLAWHAHAAGRGPRPAHRPVLPPDLQSAEG